MAERRVMCPSLGNQRRETARLLSKPLIVKETWFLLNLEWFEKFRAFIQLGKRWDASRLTQYPGPIDNVLLYKDDAFFEIADNLVENHDFMFVHEDLWNLLESWYGLVPNQTPIPRQVVDGKKLALTRIEVYPVALALMNGQDATSATIFTFSKATTIRQVAEVMKKIFDIPDYNDVEIKKWDTVSCALDYNKTIEESQLQNDQPIFLVNLGPRVIKESKTLTGINPVHKTKKDIKKKYFTPGLCGLRNMGNTCYMNSVLQCMSNCPPLAQHFAENAYKKDVNFENPIGMQGKIATAFGELLQLLWSGEHAYVSPKYFREQVGTFAPQFLSFEQQDANELLTFLLDGLHEDLNKIKIKPYIERKDSNGQPNEVLASEAWKIHNKRNDSIIVDYFHGLMKSTVVCPDCSKVSVTFDPFCNLALPLPAKRESNMEVMYFPADYLEAPLRKCLTVPKRGRISDLKPVDQHFVQYPVELIVAEVANNHFHKFYSRSDYLESICRKKNIAIFEIPQTGIFAPVPVVLWEVGHENDFSIGQLFGFPFIIFLNPTNSTYREIYRTILHKILGILAVCSADTCFCKKKGSGASTSEHDCINKGKQVLPNDLFTLYLVNTSSTSVAIKLHDDGKPISIPILVTGEKKKGRQYLAAQWTAENREAFINKRTMNNLLGEPDVSRHIQLKDCLQMFTMCEQLDAEDSWYCPHCKVYQQAIKKIDLWNLPKILVISLKRFSDSRNRREKIDSLVEFPLENLDMSAFVKNDKHPPLKYNLIGVCNHYGSMMFGHYTAYALNKDDKSWYHFDDHVVSFMNKGDVVTEAAYILFYLRSDTKMK